MRAGARGSQSESCFDGSCHQSSGLDAKKKSLRAQEQDPLSLAAWWAKAKAWPVNLLVFVDECGLNLAMTRRYSRSPGGHRAFGVAPHNRGKNTTILGALCCSGVQAVMSLEGAIDGLAFEAFIEQVSAPTKVRKRGFWWSKRAALWSFCQPIRQTLIP